MRTLVTILVTAVVLSPLTAGATIINIPGDYDTIQEGIDHGAHGDTVLVQPDIYYENLNFNGHNVVLASLFLTTGDTAYISSTIIDGSQAASVIAFSSGEDSTAQVIGFSIQNGYDYEGGGVYCYEASPTIKSNIITGNSARNTGGGITCDYSYSVIRDNVISSNSCDLGGGIYCTHSGPLIQSNLIIGNSGLEGGGVHCNYCWSSYGLTIDGNTITANSASYGGGGIFCWGSEPTISSNVICRNSAANDGGGIYCDGSSTVRNNTLYGNSAGDYGGGLFCRTGSPTIVNTILWGDTAPEIYVMSGSPTVTYCDVQGGWPGQGNIDADPLFVGPYNEDFHLRWHSPCVDAGDPSLTDPDGTCSDIGAFYFNQDFLGIIELYPHDTPIVIPPGGGSFVYDMWVFNFFGHPGRADIWTYAFVPGMGRYGPIDLYRNVRIPADSIGLNDVSQNVPGPAPAGDYVFVGYVGNYPSTIIDSSYFYFSKEGSVSGGIGDWSGSGLLPREGDAEEFDLPNDYALSGNYPNPFNASTVINYQLPASCHVKLEVYNIIGQKVVTLVDEKQEAAYRSVIWDASEVSSGVYFYKLTAGDFTVSKRMMLVK